MCDYDSHIFCGISPSSSISLPERLLLGTGFSACVERGKPIHVECFYSNTSIALEALCSTRLQARPRILNDPAKPMRVTSPSRLLLIRVLD